MKDAENYGDFLIYPESYFEIRDRHYAKKYRVDFDFFLMERVACRKKDSRYLIYYECCIRYNINSLTDTYYDSNVVMEYEEHYQCHICNKNYVL